MTVRHPDRRHVLSIVGLTALLAACTVGPGASISTTPDASSGALAAGQSQAPTPECYGMNESVDTAPLTVANLMPFSTVVVVAEVKSIEGGAWNTKDGTQPSQANRKSGKFNAGIVTPINLQVDDAWFGQAGPGAIRVVNPGGTSGCVEHRVSNAPVLVKGNTYVFFLQPSPDADGVRHPELPLVLAAWPVDAAGNVETAEEGSLDIAQVEALVKHPVAPPTTPEPTPAGTDQPG